MKCSLCGKEIKEDEDSVVRLHVVYHANVQDCLKKKKEDKNEPTN